MIFSWKERSQRDTPLPLPHSFVLLKKKFNSNFNFSSLGFSLIFHKIQKYFFPFFIKQLGKRVWHIYLGAVIEQLGCLWWWRNTWTPRIKLKCKLESPSESFQEHTSINMRLKKWESGGRQSRIEECLSIFPFYVS